jgi:hypothetical protein
MKTDKAFAAAIIATFSTFTMRADHAPRAVLPDAVVDVRTIEGVADVKGEWRYSDTHIHKIEHKSVGPDLKASGAAHRTFDFAPDARGADYDDSTWEVIPADSLEKRRGNGRLSFNGPGASAQHGMGRRRPADALPCGANRHLSSPVE